ncbi:shikimate dehydrogenase [Xinfangfangia sp. CPCC 101601]|uniref:shikimate dehydrogenase (NADP(+)) n=1 Tax=Pseudogemmobacter lacusdianii TaxID=3069608 RepID=A0ABU0W1P5_9RHOB|nr:shikimate dehydrogenase [Xinfangfangia sp. CPCC 101601]MDQ2067947.1 shikimate dehydrogenase [Xinfangfangia sp. CPCC 101601]
MTTLPPPHAKRDLTGKTSLMLMLADPVAHIRGSALINDRFAALGHDAVIAPLHVTPSDLPALVAAVRLMQNVAGLGVTIPHKISVMPHLDAVTEAAQRVGAVNFVRRDPDGRLIGTNTDGAGFVAGLNAAGIAISNQTAVMAGAGGVARAIAFSLAEAGLRELRILNRDYDKASALAQAVHAAFPTCAASAIKSEDSPQTPDLAINATSLGMAEGDALPMPISWLAAKTAAVEVVVNPAQTAFLIAAEALGCRTLEGAAMLRPQPDLVAEFFGLPLSS